MGASVLPRLPLHGGDRNRTSPFAFTGNKFEFRALGSSMSLGMPNTILNTIAAEAIDPLADKLDAAITGGASLEEAVLEHRQGDLDRQQADRLLRRQLLRRVAHGGRGARPGQPAPVARTPCRGSSSRSTVEVFGKYEVLSERELHSRYEVAVEQYITTINIEAETAASIARTMLLPAAIRWLATLEGVNGGTGIARLTEETSGLVDQFTDAIFELEAANINHPENDSDIGAAKYVQTEVFGAMDAVREIADKLERIVPDDLWPLPKYSEILFIK